LMATKAMCVIRPCELLGEEQTLRRANPHINYYPSRYTYCPKCHSDIRETKCEFRTNPVGLVVDLQHRAKIQ
jgi:hypothetical protein